MSINSIVCSAERSISANLFRFGFDNFFFDFAIVTHWTQFAETVGKIAVTKYTIKWIRIVAVISSISNENHQSSYCTHRFFLPFYWWNFCVDKFCQFYASIRKSSLLLSLVLWFIFAVVRVCVYVCIFLCLNNILFNATNVFPYVAKILNW